MEAKEKRAEFLKKAQINKANWELHLKLIKQSLGMIPFDEELLKLIDYAENYAQKNLIREVIMRQGLAFPETEQDLKWHEQKPDRELMVRLFEHIGLGRQEESLCEDLNQ